MQRNIQRNVRRTLRRNMGRSTRTSRLAAAPLALGLLALVAWGWHFGLGPAFARASNDDLSLGDTTGVVAASVPVIKVGDDWFCDSSYEDGVCRTTINAGDIVSWLWVGRSRHTTTECGGALKSCPKPHLWNSPVQDGGSFSFTFDSPGTYVYRCQVHPDTMRGEIVVLAAPPPPPPADGPPAPDNSPPDAVSPPGNEPSPGDVPPDSDSESIPPVVLSEPATGPTATAGALPDTGGAPPTGGPEASRVWWLALMTGGALIVAGLALAARWLSRRP